LGTAVQSNCANPGGDLLHLTFGYGTATANNGNPVSQTIVASGYTLTQNYGYDPVNRLKIAVEGAAVPGSMTCPVTTSWCQEYNYDHFGNRWVTSNLSLHLATPTSSAAFSATTNRLTAASYDNAGNMTAHPFITPSGSIGYDANNLATQFTATGMSASYGYDAQGRRVRVTHNGSLRFRSMTPWDGWRLSTPRRPRRRRTVSTTEQPTIWAARASSPTAPGRSSCAATSSHTARRYRRALLTATAT